MSKSYILRKKEIYHNRAHWWEYHYQRHELVKNIAPSLNAGNIIAVIQKYIPTPELLIDASMLRGRPHINGAREAEDILGWRYPQNELLCIWYWGENYWQNFVKAFQNLPDVYEDYLYIYDAEIDALRFSPIGEVRGKSGGSRGEVGGSRAVPPIIEDFKPKKSHHRKVPPIAGEFPHSSPIVPP